MKKYLIYIGILAIGLLLGWLLFGGSNDQNKEHNHKEANKAEQLWTCSMHPQIRKPEAGDCPICGMDLIPLAKDNNDSLPPNQISLSPAPRYLRRCEQPA